MMFAASIVTYLLVRKSSLLKIPNSLVNLAMFGIPFVIYVVMAIIENPPLVITWWHVLILLVVAIVFSYLGNKASLRAIDLAPNPGYSLVLSKSYVLFTMLVAVVFMGAEMTLQKAIATVLIVGFSIPIMVTRSGEKKTKHRTWVLLSLAAFFAWGFLSLSSKWLFTHGIPTMTFLVYLYLIVTLCIVIIDRVRISQVKHVSRRGQWTLLGVGVASALFNIGQFEAINLAPNVGYVNAINAASIAAVTIFAVILFRDNLTWSKGIGVLGVTMGLVLLLV
jgi:drug/metabolite transporter (DMT)-like permease